MWEESEMGLQRGRLVLGFKHRHGSRVGAFWDRRAFWDHAALTEVETVQL